MLEKEHGRGQQAFEDPGRTSPGADAYNQGPSFLMSIHASGFLGRPLCPEAGSQVDSFLRHG